VSPRRRNWSSNASSVIQWLGQHPRWTPNKRRLKRAVFHSLVSLQEAINRFVAEANTESKHFQWAKDLNTIIAAVRRGHQVLDYSG
jgi:hypothetical protein